MTKALPLATSDNNTFPQEKSKALHLIVICYVKTLNSSTSGGPPSGFSVSTASLNIIKLLWMPPHEINAVYDIDLWQPDWTAVLSRVLSLNYVSIMPNFK